MQDNETRWNSRDNRNTRLLQLQPAVELFQKSYNDEILENALLNKDWEALRDEVEVLEPFRQLSEVLQTRAAEGRNGSIWETLPAIEHLLEHVEALKAKQPRDKASEPQRNALNNTWKVLTKYYKLTDAVPTVYFIATLLNPTLRIQYFENHWSKDSVLKKAMDKHKKTVYTYWKNEYSTRPVITPPPQIPRKRTLLEAFLHPTVTPEADEFTAYLKGPVTVVPEGEQLNLLKWWDTHKQQYPTLSQLALDILSIPAMSTECERVFSGAGLLVTNRKKRLSADVIEAIECLRTWWHEGIIQHVPDSDDEVSGDEGV